MRNLILLFLKYRGFVAFLLLEAVCMILVIRYNRAQRDIYLNSASIFSAGMYESMDNLKQFYYLSDVADSLAAENARLKGLISNNARNEAIVIDSSLFFSQDDTIQQYKYLPARVVNNSTNQNNNTLTISKGYLDGVKQREGVVSNKGIVGITRTVNKNYSTVMSILNRQVRISTSLKRTNNIGALAWRGDNPTLMKLEDVPKHADVVKGDTVITSGYTARFPRGILVGTVDSVWLTSGSNFYDIQIKLMNDLNSVRYVYIIQNKMSKAQDAIEETLSDEQ